MKLIKIAILAAFLAPVSVHAANDFQLASQLLSAAKSGNTQQVQYLIASGANVDYVDNTGLSLICTAIMNNDTRTAQILQMYGADGSDCDIQIKRYRNLGPQAPESGIFADLSTPQGMFVAVAGGAAAVGGIALLSGSLGFGGGDDTGSSGLGCTPGASCVDANGNTGTCSSAGVCIASGTDTGTGDGATAVITLPYGPAMVDADSEAANYVANLDAFSTGAYLNNFEYMTDDYGQNYLLLMKGYSPFARGYLGMTTLRNNANAPFSGTQLGTLNTGGLTVEGGIPVNVALITSNGINSNGANGISNTTESSLDDKFVLWTTRNGEGLADAVSSNVSSKYYNNEIVVGTVGDFDTYTTQEDDAIMDDFNYSGYDSVVNNAGASVTDNLLAKIVGGTLGGYGVDDFVGFMPNGQMTIFRTGAGYEMIDADDSVVGAYTMNGSAFGTGDVLNITSIGFDITVTMDSDSNILADDRTFTATGTNGSGESVTYKGYVGNDGYVYMDTDSNTDGYDTAYAISGTDLLWEKQLVAGDYTNYKALIESLALGGNVIGSGTSTLNYGKTKPTIVANLSIVPTLRDGDAKTIDDILSLTDSDDRKVLFGTYVNDVYDIDSSDGDSQGSNALAFFEGFNPAYPLTIFSAGSFDTGNSLWAGATLDATFENSAPLVFDNMEHRFMTVVAVAENGGTDGQSSIAGYNPDSLILSQWTDTNGTTDTADDTYYKSRACGVAGTGGSGIDPWCFAAAGVTDELATAAAAGAAGAVQSAFSYMSEDEIFILMALTASGSYLGTSTDGVAYTDDTLRAYLESMYTLPGEYQFRVDNGEDYFDVFSEVFGYGLIDLERATKPGSSIYYYNGNTGQIVSASGDAYWRKASATRFSSSSVLNLSGGSISAPFYDILTNIDGTVQLPRVFENEFSLGATNSRGLYMGDVLGGMNVYKNNNVKDINLSEDMTLSIAMSESADINTDAGLDYMSFGYSVGDFDMAAGFQNYFNDNLGRFDGTSNPILGLASDAVSADMKYNVGDFAFGARVFSASITDESLLETDPTASNDIEAARLGLFQGAESALSWNNSGLGLTASFGTAIESDTILGAYSDGLLNMGAGQTYYMDMNATYEIADDINVSGRMTFANTSVEGEMGEFIMGMSDLNSNSFSVGADIGNFSFAIASPLAITSGNLQHMYTEYETVETSDGVYDLVIKDSYIRDMDLSADNREIRFSGYYRTKLGTHTDGAIGFIHRINPDHTKEFGNESVFMLKLKHTVGI